MKTDSGFRWEKISNATVLEGKRRKCGGAEIKLQTKGEDNRQSQLSSGYKLNRILKIFRTLL